MITEKINLLSGVLFEGKKYKTLTMRSPIVKDSVEAEEEAKDRGILYLSLSLLSRMIVEFGDIPKDQITAGLLMQLDEEDFERLQIVRDYLKKKVHWSSEN
jgi:phage FluMu protein gp41